MYMPVSVSPAAARSGLGTFRRMDSELQESEFYPPPYNTDSPIDLTDVYGIAAAGLGDVGMGLFDNPLDWTTYGWQEWLTLGAGLYFGIKLLSDVGKGAQSVRKSVRSRRARRERKQKLKEELATL